MNKLIASSRNQKIIFYIVTIGVSILLGLLFTSVEFHAGSIEYLNEKIGQVLALCASSAAISTGITLLPGDAGTTVAEAIMDSTGYFFVVLLGLYLEKYLLVLTSYLSFYFLFPLACLIKIKQVLLNQFNVSKIARKLVIFGLMILCIIPISVQVSKLVEHTFDYQITDLQNEAVALENEINEESNKQNEIIIESQNDSFWDKTTKVFGHVVDSIGGILGSFAKSTSELLEKANQLLANFIEKAVIMIITSCVIPIAVFFLFLMGTKYILELDINVNNLSNKLKVGNYKLKSILNKQDKSE